jgi:phosphatidylglycerophosphate synthase
VSPTTAISTAHAAAGSPRRILATRNADWARRLAGRLGRAGVRPNSISITGVVFALAAAAAFALVPDVTGVRRAAALTFAAAAIQLRLLCNLLDGMLAVEEGFKTSTGEIYNDIPDRVADVLILVGAGYSIRFLPGGQTLGWAAAVAAVFTAYVRVLGGSLRVTQPFIGPMAKQHRMFTLTIAALIFAAEVSLAAPPRGMRIGLGLIVVGSVLTACRRTVRIVRAVDAR